MEEKSKVSTGEGTSPVKLILIAVLVLLLLLAGVIYAQYSYMQQKQAQDIPWEYAADKILCIGDSLTSGAYFGNDYAGADIEQRYSYYLGRMLNTEVTNAGHAGYSASDWYNKYLDAFDYSEYNTFVIWLGTNNAPANTLEQDVLPFAAPEEYAETETGYYCRIIEKIRSENPDSLILLINVFASKSDVAEANLAIASIAEHYGLPLLDLSHMGSEEHPEFHVGIQNPHLGKAGNIYVASRIVDCLKDYFMAQPLRCEFGADKLAE